ncbi:hypothetical protein AX774_g193 [Zancudomyces culisetae]|uniref:THO1-MOS11 C-terminal domain-containing protein n=1 Tax=Zancudomyces culisetae TaxID=1213189 RepID=A0A1R1PZC7_ZANCU|nr:hypothetical protein AX774_g193 [Zancudomyces culisetae]|eukprot:OMH86301.1 hypothetical protein AX774_g193 [Zancudomyces culisetae]
MVGQAKRRGRPPKSKKTPPSAEESADNTGTTETVENVENGNENVEEGAGAPIEDASIQAKDALKGQETLEASQTRTEIPNEDKKLVQGLEQIQEPQGSDGLKKAGAEPDESEKKKLRAARFGSEPQTSALTDEEKKRNRLLRFGQANAGPDESNASTQQDVIKKRALRFGMPLKHDLEEDQEKARKRRERFGGDSESSNTSLGDNQDQQKPKPITAGVDEEEEEKRRKRALRFGLGV